jgi:phosphoribosylformylglycinamidine cyclo-ligase
MENEKKSGMDIELGDRCSKVAYSWAKKTFTNRKGRAGEPYIGLEGAFSNMISFGKAKIGISSDGIGTKIELAERTGIYHTLGFDLVAMVADDLIAGGFEPSNLSNILDVDFLDYDIVDSLMKGLHDASNQARIAVTGGEIAELGNRINGYGDKMHFNWCSTAIGMLHPSLTVPIDGSGIRDSDKVVSLRSRGFRSNGFSLLRRIMKDSFGEDWHQHNYDKDRSWGEALIIPSLIYSPVICDVLREGYTITGIAHITGGGIKDNFNRVLKSSGLGASLDKLFQPSDIMKKVMELGNINMDDAYTYWNMGNGMLIIVRGEEAEAIIKKIGDMGYETKICGCINDKPGIEIK